MEKKVGQEIRERKSIQKINIVRAKFTDITLDYKFKSKPIGSGGFGSVYKAQHRETGQIRAIKHLILKENLAKVSSNGKIYILVFYNF
jgi:hypothetical protein